MMQRLFWLLLIGCSLLTFDARANKFPQSSVDELLLRSDVIVFATVAKLEQVPAGALIHLDTVKVVASRQAIGSTVSIGIATQVVNSELSPLPHQPHIRVGRRYLLFLRGGNMDSPLIDFARSIYEVNDDGFVDCGGGVVYGITPNGLHCAAPGRMVSVPIGEAQLIEQLADQLERARFRRPQLAAEEDASARVIGEAP